MSVVCIVYQKETIIWGNIIQKESGLFATPVSSPTDY